uniref:Uncharacterized protein n=1 Tax=Panagrolaimus davidi TaxID=227884 RepID=A0A914Q8Y0_9BILA
MLLIFLLLLNTAVAAAKVKYICTSNHTIEITSDTVVFFESPNFPRHMTAVEINQCYLNFTKTLPPEKHTKFVIVISNLICHGRCKMLYDYIPNVSSYFFRLKDQFDLAGYEAFQGFAYFDDWGDDCPLESVSRINPFQFTDLSEVIVIRSTFNPKKPRIQPCLWQFKAPVNFGFKIVITSLNVSDSTVFKVVNNQDTIIT